MPTIGTIVNYHLPSPSTGKDTPDESNHDNAPLPIQTANSPNSSLNNWEITHADLPKKAQHLNTLSSQENPDNDPMLGLHLLSEAAMQHGQRSDNTQDASDTNKAKESTRNASNQATVIFIEKKTLQHNSSLSNSEKHKTYVCNYKINIVKNQICGKQLLGEFERTEHIKIHAKGKHYFCHFCDKIFNFPSFLEVHERNHNGSKPFICHVCNRAFAQRTNLKKHIRTHTGDKPYLCEICGKLFTQSNTLSQHELTHTMEKNFVCETCNKAFGRKFALTRHVKTHTKNE